MRWEAFGIDKFLKNSKVEKEEVLKQKLRPGVKRVIIIGTGDCGKILVGEIHRGKRAIYEIVGLIDDDIIYQ